MGGFVAVDTESLADVNEAEGAVLGLIGRRPNITRYQILRFFQQSPVKFQNVSKGSVYPLISRLEERRLIVSKEGQGPHSAPVYSLAEGGHEALGRWVKRITLQQMLPLDPLKLKVLSLQALSPAERIAWIAAAKQLILEKKAELEGYRERLLADPYGEIVYAADFESLDAKLVWLDRLLIEVARDLTPKG